MAKLTEKRQEKCGEIIEKKLICYLGFHLMKHLFIRLF